MLVDGNYMDTCFCIYHFEWIAMMVSDHIDSNWPRSCSRIAGVLIAQSRRGMQLPRYAVAAFNMEKTREEMNLVQTSFERFICWDILFATWSLSQWWLGKSNFCRLVIVCWRVVPSSFFTDEVNVKKDGF